MKKWIYLTVMLTMGTLLFVTGCGGSNVGTLQSKDLIKVGMVTDSGTIDDKSFNQGTWEGIQRYEKENKTVTIKYLKPLGEQKDDYLTTMNDISETGYKIIVCPGFKFEQAVHDAAISKPDNTYILIDGEPKDADNKAVKHDNVVSVYFAEHESGFLAGVAAALSTKTGKLGFVGGMEIPPVQRFGWGFQAGVKYANANLGTKAEITKYIYQGTFNDVAAGQTLAAGMYDQGIDIIFHASGGVGVGVFNEAKQRAEKGSAVYVIGVDVDQYSTGTISNGKSVTLTSAMKRIDVAAYNYIDAKLKDKFPGGQIITLTMKENGVGLPEKNPNLSEDTIKKVEEAKKAVLDGKFIVPSTKEALDTYLK